MVVWFIIGLLCFFGLVLGLMSKNQQWFILFLNIFWELTLLFLLLGTFLVFLEFIAKTMVLYDLLYTNLIIFILFFPWIPFNFLQFLSNYVFLSATMTIILLFLWLWLWSGSINNFDIITRINYFITFFIIILIFAT